MARLHGTRVILPLLLALLIAPDLGSSVSLIPSDCAPEDPSALAEAASTAALQCSADVEGNGDSELAQRAAELNCIAERLGIDRNVEAWTVIENFIDPDDTYFSLIWEQSWGYCKMRIPASLSDNQARVFLLACLEEITPVACSHYEGKRRCSQATRQLTESRCSLRHLVSEETWMNCLSEAKLDGTSLPEDWWLPGSSLSCVDLLSAVHSSMACALEATGLYDGEVQHSALQTVVSEWPEAEGFTNILVKCPTTVVEHFTPCWTSYEPAKCVTFTSTEVAEALQEEDV